MLPRGAAAARWLALLVPLGLLAGAYIGQYFFRLFPCEMCWWQRYAHFAALACALLAMALSTKRALVVLAGAALLVAGLLGGYHAGVEYHWWEGITHCATAVKFGGDPLDAIMRAPNIRCDEPQWSLFGVSLAGFNFLISTGAALVIFGLVRRAGRAAR